MVRPQADPPGMVSAVSGSPRGGGKNPTPLAKPLGICRYSAPMALKYLFFDDYSEGAHPRVLRALADTNLRQERGYGEDSFARAAARLITERIGQPDAEVHFVSSGTHANLICLSSMLRPFESVIAPDNGHAVGSEAGAIEGTGHKMNAVPGVAGKLVPEAIRDVVAAHGNEHTVLPRAVYISQATELGTVYSKQELTQLRDVCAENQLYLYVDGARIGNAVMSVGADLDLAETARLCDMFYIGGTKNGALLGEAIVIVNPALQDRFRNHLRHRGGLLAKARAVTVQFVELFADDLYMENAKHANDMAQLLAAGIRECGHGFLHEPVANQIFPILPNPVIRGLQENFGFYKWSDAPSSPDSSSVRLVTSWATTEAGVTAFLDDLRR
jgi:threonine aldolase